MLSAKFFDERQPLAGIFFEFPNLVRVDCVTQITSDHFLYNFAERLSSAMNALGAERAARSTIRDKRVHSL